MGMDFRTAVGFIHRDPHWWRKVLLGGALMLTVVGVPWGAGFVVERLDAVRKGYPSPLPPWRDWSMRYVIGFFAVLIDIVFFLLPLVVIGLVCACSALLVVFRGGVFPQWLGGLVFFVVLLYEFGVFMLGVAPIGRLMYVEGGRPEEAMGFQVVRAACATGARSVYRQARLRSLPAYFPAVVLGGAFWLVVRQQFSGVVLVSVVLLWLMLSAVLYAQLVVVQLYAAAEQVVRAGAAAHGTW